MPTQLSREERAAQNKRELNDALDDLKVLFSNAALSQQLQYDHNYYGGKRRNSKRRQWGDENEDIDEEGADAERDQEESKEAYSEEEGAASDEYKYNDEDDEYTPHSSRNSRSTSRHSTRQTTNRSTRSAHQQHSNAKPDTSTAHADGKKPEKGAFPKAPRSRKSTTFTHFSPYEFNVRESLVQKHVWDIWLPSITVLGASGTGKTSITISLCWELSDQFPLVLAINGSEEGNSVYGRLIRRPLITTRFSSKFLLQLIVRQKKYKRDYSRVNHITGEKQYGFDSNPQALLIIDDAINKQNKGDPTLEMFYKMARHFSVAIIVMAHKHKDLANVCRESSRYVVIANQNSESVRRDMMREWCPGIPESIGHDYFLTYTQHNWFIIIDVHESRRSTKPERYFKVIKSRHREPDFQMGSAEINFQAAKYELREDEDDRPFNPDCQIFVPEPAKTPDKQEEPEGEEEDMWIIDRNGKLTKAW